MQDPVVPIGSQSMLLSLQSQAGIVSWAEFSEHIAYLPQAEQVQVQTAFEQCRQSDQTAGQSIQSALLLAALQADSSSICAVLLLPLITSGTLSVDDSKTAFGNEVATLLTQLLPLQQGRSNATPDTIRQHILTMPGDLRVIVIAVTNVLGTLQCLSDTGRKADHQYAGVYQQLARLLSLRDIAALIELQLLRLQHPHDYLNVIRQQQKRQKQSAAILQLISAAFSDTKAPTVTVQPVNMPVVAADSPLQIELECEDTESCYRVWSRLHTGFKQLQSSLCDEISVPAYDGSRSLQTTLLLQTGAQVQCTIGTADMLAFRQNGVATLCFEPGILGLPDYFPWMDRLQQLAEATNGSSTQFLQVLETDIFAEQVVLYGPGDTTIYVPGTATVLDAAFFCLGEQAAYVESIKANGEPVPLNQLVSTGLQLSFSESKTRQLRRHWLTNVRTATAQSEIKTILGRPPAAKRISIGRTVLQNLMHQRSKGFLEEYDTDQLQPAIDALGGASLDDVLLQIADNVIDADEVYSAFFEPEADAFTPEPCRIDCTMPQDNSSIQHDLLQLCRRYQIAPSNVQFRRVRPQRSDQAVVLHATASYPQQQLLCKQLQDLGIQITGVRKKTANLPVVVAGAAVLILLWGINPFVIKGLLSLGAMPLGITVIRAWSVALCASLMLFANKRNQRFMRISLHHPSLWVAGGMFALVNLCTNLTIATGSPLLYSTILRGNAVLLTIPFFMRKRQLSGGLAIWLLAITAFALIAVSPEPPLAILLAFAALASFVVYTVASRRFQLVAKVSARYQQFIFFTSAIAALALLPLLAVQPAALPSLPLIGLIALYSVCFVVTPYTLYYAIMHRIQHAPTLSGWIHTVVLVTLAGQIVLYGWQGTVLLSIAAILLIVSSMTAAQLSASTSRDQ